MPDERVVFEAWENAAGVCMTPAAFAFSADVPELDVLLTMADWSDATLQQCVYVAEGTPPMLTAAGVRLAVELLTAKDEEAPKALLRRLALVEDVWLDRVMGETSPPATRWTSK